MSIFINAREAEKLSTNVAQKRQDGIDTVYNKNKQGLRLNYMLASLKRIFNNIKGCTETANYVYPYENDIEDLTGLELECVLNYLKYAGGYSIDIAHKVLSWNSPNMGLKSSFDDKYPGLLNYFDRAGL